MNPANNPSLAAAPPIDSPELMALPQRQKVVLVMDLVESVRLMAANELAVVDHWRGFVRHATTNVLPQHEGRMVKSLGDGIMVEFESPRNAANAAIALHRYFDPANAALPPDQQLYLRAGLNTAQVYIDDIDIYGSGVNLAARVASLAGPGETMVTAEVRDGLTDGLDAKVEDMGECYLKHVAQPVRAFRVGEAGIKPILTPQREYSAALQPTIAVVPFESRGQSDQHLYIGDLIADGVIALLGTNSDLLVISRLSSASVQVQPESVDDARLRLGADFVLIGSYVATEPAQHGCVLISATLYGTKANDLIWVDRFNIDLHDLLADDSQTALRLATGILDAIRQASSKRAVCQPMPTLTSYSLLLSGITFMHKSTQKDMRLSRQLLEHLTERHPRATTSHAWLAKSFVLNAVSSFGSKREDAQRALTICKDALEKNPENSLSLAVLAHVYTHLECDAPAAQKCVTSALRFNPNESMAWLFKSVLSTMWGDPKNAVTEAVHATALSPADPLSYYYKMILAAAHASDQNFAASIRLAHESLRLNRLHPPTWRVLITAQVHGGDLAAGHASYQEFLKLDPNFSIANYLAAGNASSRTKRQFVDAARELGYF